MTADLGADVEIRYCPLGPPRTTRPIAYAYCSECQRVRKSTLDCPMVALSPNDGSR